MIKKIGVLLVCFFVYAAMYLSAIGAGQTIMGFFDTVSLLIVFGIAYCGMLAAYGTIIPDLKGLKLMNKLFMPAGWLGFMIGFVMMLYSMGSNSDNMSANIGLSVAVALIAVLYSILLKIVFTIIIASKE
tara:strand:- start:2774 stop:3163 length:390 start_codon:yes stop_codon:yes gene_type:complete